MAHVPTAKEKTGSLSLQEIANLPHGATTKYMRKHIDPEWNIEKSDKDIKYEIYAEYMGIFRLKIMASCKEEAVRKAPACCPLCWCLLWRLMRIRLVPLLILALFLFYYQLA